MSFGALMIKVTGTLYPVPAASGFSDDFSNAAVSASNWTITEQGTTGGTGTVNTGAAVLTPKASAINSVAMRHSGSYKSVAATLSIAPNGGNAQYLTLSLGSGALSTLAGNTSSWWYTTPQTGYFMALFAPGNISLYRANGPGVAATVLATGTGGGASGGGDNAFRAASHTYELVVDATGVSVNIDGAQVLHANDTTYTAGGDIVIAQGEYTSGAGGVATVTDVVAA